MLMGQNGTSRGLKRPVGNVNIFINIRYFFILISRKINLINGIKIGLNNIFIFTFRSKN